MYFVFLKYISLKSKQKQITLKLNKMKPLSILLLECREANKLMSKYARTNQIELFVKWAEKVSELENLIINYNN